MGNADTMNIISEPEAAAISVMNELGSDALRIDETFVVCDAGGGTVDLVSYTVKALKPILQVQEAATGSGNLCGAMFLNRIFAKDLKDKFGGNPSWNKGVLNDAMLDFETKVKKHFDGKVNRVYKVRLEVEDDPRVQGKKLTLSGLDVKKIFDPVIDEVIKLVKEQIRRTQGKVTTVILVGGFGNNKYLQKRLEAEVDRGISVKKSGRPQIAVVEGALMKALNEELDSDATIRVESRRARRHYGTSVYAPFVEGVHDSSRKQPHRLSGGHRVRIMKWFINKDDLVEELSPVPFRFYWDQKVSDGPPGVIKMTIYSCEDPENTGAPTYEDEKVTELGTLKADLRNIPKEELNQEHGMNNEMFYKIDFEIEMTMLSANITFALVYKGKRYPAVPFEFL